MCRPSELFLSEFSLKGSVICGCHHCVNYCCWMNCANYHLHKSYCHCNYCVSCHHYRMNHHHRRSYVNCPTMRSYGSPMRTTNCVCYWDGYTMTTHHCYEMKNCDSPMRNPCYDV